MIGFLSLILRCRALWARLLTLILAHLSTQALASTAFHHDISGNLTTRQSTSSTPPVLVTSLLRDTMQIGDDAVRFMAVAKGAGPFTYEWRRNGVVMPGATGDVLVVPFPVTNGDTYAVTVSNPYGSVSSIPAAVLLESKEVITREVAIHVGGVHTPEMQYVESREVSLFSGAEPPFRMVESREVSVVVSDDAAPPRVEDFSLASSAMGDRVDLDWSAYNARDVRDLARYDIYYSSRPFSSIAGMTPVASVGGEAFQWTQSGLPQWQDHFFAVVPVDGDGNRISDVVYSAAYVLMPETLTREVGSFVGQEPPPPPDVVEPVLVRNFGFEEPPQSGYSYYGSMSDADKERFGWSVAGNQTSGPAVAANGSAWGYQGAPEGNQVVSLQMTASVSQIVEFPGAGTYTLSWWDASRGGQVNPYLVTLDGIPLAEAFSTSNPAWQERSVTFQIPDAGTGTLVFAGQTAATDSSVGIDDVRLTKFVAKGVRVLYAQRTVEARELGIFVGAEPDPPYRRIETRELGLVVADDAIPAPVTVPDKVFGAIVSKDRHGSVVLDWNGYDLWAQRDVVRYRIYYSDRAFGNVHEPGVQFAGVSQDGLMTTVVGGLFDPKVHHFAVVAEDALGNFDPVVQSRPTEDPIPSLWEFALGRGKADSATSADLGVASAVGPGHLEYRYSRRKLAVEAGTAFLVEWSEDLQTWRTDGVTQQVTSDDGEVQNVTALVPRSGKARLFGRLKVVPEVAPVISRQPLSGTIISGQSATLSVAAAGSKMLSYQWYQGRTGATAHPVGTNSASFTTPALNSTTSYWVRVTHSGYTMDSVAATVTVITPPAMTLQPASCTIASGATVTLRVAATGTAPLTYQWYQGEAGTTSMPVGSNSTSFTTPALSSTSNFWVRVRNAVGTVDSETATVTIALPPAITTQPSSAEISIGGSGTLTVVAEGTAPLTYQWYQGATGNTTTPLGENSPSLTIPSVMVAATYWVRVANAVGSVNSVAATLNVVRPPQIMSQPASPSITTGGTAILTVSASGTGNLDYQWYQGPVGMTANPVGTNLYSFTTPALGSTTGYWVRVGNSAGTVDSAPAVVSVTAPPAAPTGFSTIPGGSFTMGRTSGDTDSDAPPVVVNVSTFFMGKTEVTKGLWDEVRIWAIANGYSDLAAGQGKAANHPVYGLKWFEVVKWCNARSEKEGLTPCYRVDGEVMRAGEMDPTLNGSANGYRLPTEAEWEKAARGGLTGRRFPSGIHTISHSEANFDNEGGEAYAIGTTGLHPTYSTGSIPHTSPVGSFAATGYGLHDMAGNVYEWCGDRYGYRAYLHGMTDPRGPESGNHRVYRGGNWLSSAMYCRAAHRSWVSVSVEPPTGLGFRVARNSIP